MAFAFMERTDRLLGGINKWMLTAQQIQIPSHDLQIVTHSICLRDRIIEDHPHGFFTGATSTLAVAVSQT